MKPRKMNNIDEKIITFSSLLNLFLGTSLTRCRKIINVTTSVKYETVFGKRIKNYTKE